MPISLNLLKRLTHLRTSLQPSLHKGRYYCTDTSTGRSTVIVQNSLQGTYRSSLVSLARGEGRGFTSPYVFNGTV